MNNLEFELECNNEKLYEEQRSNPTAINNCGEGILSLLDELNESKMILLPTQAQSQIEVY